jgi:hypothetical protein
LSSQDTKGEEQAPSARCRAQDGRRRRVKFLPHSNVQPFINLVAALAGAALWALSSVVRSAFAAQRSGN